MGKNVYQRFGLNRPSSVFYGEFNRKVNREVNRELNGEVNRKVNGEFNRG